MNEQKKRRGAPVTTGPSPSIRFRLHKELYDKFMELGGKEWLNSFLNNNAFYNWQPIETVPLNQPILVHNGKIVTVTVLGLMNGKPRFMHPHGFGGYDWDYEFCVDELTHWMPLPTITNI